MKKTFKVCRKTQTTSLNEMIYHVLAKNDSIWQMFIISVLVYNFNKNSEELSFRQMYSKFQVENIYLRIARINL